MPSNTTKSISFALKVKGSEEARQELITLGADGQEALKKLEEAGAPAGTGLLAVNAVIEQLADSVQDLSGRTGAAGSVLLALGAGGLAAGAVIGGLVAIAVAAKQAADELSEIGRSAQIAGLQVEAYQELVYAAQSYDVTVDGLTDGIKELTLRSDEFAVSGAGSAEESFRRLGYSTDDVKQKMRDIPAFFEEIASKMQGLAKPAQLRIADELFGGQGGEQFVALLAQGGDEIKRLREEARATGQVVDAEVIGRADEVADKFELAAKAVRTQFNVSLLETKGILDGLAEAMGWLARKMQELRAPGKGDLLAKDLYLSRQMDQLDAAAQAVAIWEDRLTAPTLSDAAREQFTERLATAKAHLAEQAAYVDGLKIERDRIAAILNGDTSSPDVGATDRPLNLGQLPPTKPATPNAKADVTGAAGQKRISDELRDMALRVAQYQQLALAAQDGQQAVQKLQDILAAEDRGASLGIDMRSADGQRYAELTYQEAAAKEHFRVMQEGRAVTEQLRTAQESYNAELERLQGLLDAGAISQDTFTRGSLQAKETLDSQNKGLQELKDFGEATFSTIGNALSRAATEGKSAWKALGDVGKTVLGDLLQETLKLAAINPLKNAIFGYAGQQVLPTLASMFTFADGGVMTPQGPVPLRAYSAGGIANSPQLALYGEAGPEAYVPLPDGRTIPVTLRGAPMGGGQTVVQIIDQRKASAPAVTQSRSTQGDTDIITVTIAETITRDISTGGPISASMQRSFGLSRSGR